MRGITLVEITVASFVMSILLAVAVKVLVPAMRAWGDGQKRSEASQSALVTANWIGDDMLRSSPGSVEVTPEGILVMKCTPGQTHDHTTAFSNAVAYWLEGTELFRGSQDLSALPDDEPGKPPSITIADAVKLDSKRKIASHVRAFQPAVVQPWRITLNIEIDRGGRTVVINTSFSSIYAPFDPNLAEEQKELEEAPP